MTDIIATVRDSNLKLTLAFGIGLHHAGLHERDRKTVEELFVNCKIQVPFFTLVWQCDQVNIQMLISSTGRLHKIPYG